MRRSTKNQNSDPASIHARACASNQYLNCNVLSCNQFKRCNACENVTWLTTVGKTKRQLAILLREGRLRVGVEIDLRQIEGAKLILFSMCTMVGRNTKRFSQGTFYSHTASHSYFANFSCAFLPNKFKEPCVQIFLNFLHFSFV